MTRAYQLPCKLRCKVTPLIDSQWFSLIFTSDTTTRQFTATSQRAQSTNVNRQPSTVKTQLEPMIQWKSHYSLWYSGNRCQYQQGPMTFCNIGVNISEDQWYFGRNCCPGSSLLTGIWILARTGTIFHTQVIFPLQDTLDFSWTPVRAQPFEFVWE